MDDHRFDALTRSLGRRHLAALGAGSLVTVLTLVEETKAKKKRKKKKKNAGPFAANCPRNGATCLEGGPKCTLKGIPFPGICVPTSSGPFCAFGLTCEMNPAPYCATNADCVALGYGPRAVCVTCDKRTGCLEDKVCATYLGDSPGVSRGGLPNRSQAASN